jgi:hypothetical protein
MASAYFQRIGKLGGKANKTYHTSMLPIVRKMAKAGMTEIEISDSLGIAPKTLWEWKAQYSRFSSALDLGKAQSNKRIERALYHRAAGYTHDAVKVFNDKGEPVIVPYREHVPPDTNAAIFWLKNRKPEAWQDRSVVDGSISLNVGELVAKGRQRVLAARAQAPVIDAETIE